MPRLAIRRCTVGCWGLFEVNAIKDSDIKTTIEMIVRMRPALSTGVVRIVGDGSAENANVGELAVEGTRWLSSAMGDVCFRFRGLRPFRLFWRL